MLKASVRMNAALLNGHRAGPGVLLGGRQWMMWLQATWWARAPASRTGPGPRAPRPPNTIPTGRHEISWWVEGQGWNKGGTHEDGCKMESKESGSGGGWVGGVGGRGWGWGGGVDEKTVKVGEGTVWGRGGGGMIGLYINNVHYMWWTGGRTDRRTDGWKRDH